VAAGWSLRVLGLSGDLALERLSQAGDEWFGEGPGGVLVGDLETVVSGCAGEEADPEWVTAVIEAIRRDVEVGCRRSSLLVKRGSGRMFHASRSTNRESISRHGLDWRLMTGWGIAGSRAPEWPGVYLCADLEGARWFAGMPAPATADIWSVSVDGLWLEGDPSASGGGDDDWMISAQPIPASALILRERDVRGRELG
jgi:hypothetical protein